MPHLITVLKIIKECIFKVIYKDDSKVLKQHIVPFRGYSKFKTNLQQTCK